MAKPFWFLFWCGYFPVYLFDDSNHRISTILLYYCNTNSIFMKSMFTRGTVYLYRQDFVQSIHHRTLLIYSYFLHPPPLSHLPPTMPKKEGHNKRRQEESQKKTGKEDRPRRQAKKTGKEDRKKAKRKPKERKKAKRKPKERKKERNASIINDDTMDVVVGV